MIEWSDKFKTGIEIVDEQHKELFRLFNQVYELYNNEFIIDKYDQIITAVEELKDYTKYHFKAEEDYMLSIRYKKFFEHKIKHEDFIRKIDSIDYNIIDNNQQNHLLELLKFITDWLVEHVITVDKQIS
ncbi:hemerythrin family protein [Clostridium sp. AL.422]|uniref:bacteriohemerythrin n=1 Tax=Clostridium TaxID=1485 RepID=UPI00293DB780|nr:MULTISPECIES: hemerythrin family protein [unclassified Clostridium]MDV4151302.1 hemerythrin family protein [Clostridium sp. AL.422]